MAKITRLLFPADVSELCALAIPNFAKLAKQLKAELTILHVVDTSGFYYDVMDVTYRRVCDIEAEKMAVAQRHFDKFLSGLSICLPVHSVVKAGKIAPTIAAYAESGKYDAILLPTTHHNRLYAAMRKSLTAKLMDDSQAAIWTIDSALADRETGGGGCVICAIASHEDGSLDASNRNIIETARFVAERFGSGLMFVHVMEKKESADDETARRIEEELQDLCVTAGVKAKYRLKTGDTARCISDVAWQHNATLLVAGRNHRQPLFGATQSMVLDIVHLAPCPVLSVIRTPKASSGSTA
jgi:nucleotide-binding universal stress UspA family protein